MDSTHHSEQGFSHLVKCNVQNIQAKASLNTIFPSHLPRSLPLKSQLLSLPLPSLDFKLNHLSQTPLKPLPRSLPPQHLQTFSRTARIAAPENGAPWMDLRCFFDGEFIDGGGLEEAGCVGEMGYGVADGRPALRGWVFSNL